MYLALTSLGIVGVRKRLQVSLPNEPLNALLLSRQVSRPDSPTNRLFCNLEDHRCFWDSQLVAYGMVKTPRFGVACYTPMVSIVKRTIGLARFPT